MNAQVKKLLRGKKACAPASHLWLKKKNGSMTKGAVKIGEGQYGKVYRGCVDEGCEKYIVYKEIRTPSLNENVPLARFKKALDEINPKMEYTIAKKLEGFGVPKMYLYKTCDRKDILYSEYINGKELAEWLWNQPSLFAIRSVMLQVIYNLYRIQKKYPGFRHHDLHLRNILVRPVPMKALKITLDDKTYMVSNAGFEAVMIDFGFSMFPRIKNPLINTNNYKNIGISRKSDKHYDLHYFLNSVHAMVLQPRTRTERVVKIFIENLLPANYLVNKSNSVKNSRLRGNKSVNLSFEEVLSKPFFTGEKTVMVPMPKPQKPVIIMVPKKKFQSPANKKAAIARAAAMLKAIPKKRKPIIRRK
jgi:tRNA A-37 threonylcarbamoyl transferase component Bud32|tara:strand:+ start:238 stop:1317 length:1080 start_codon:yes stop_codon:yes gene_type:complete